MAIKRNEMFAELREGVQDNSDLSLVTIYERIAARFPIAAPHLLYDQVEQSMRRWRRELQPPIPRTLGDYATALQGHQRYEPRFLALVEAAGARAVILGMEGFDACLQQAEVIAFDGTFDTAPLHPQVHQILTVHSVVENKLVLMENRQQELYTACLERLCELTGNPAPQFLISDYEVALQNSLRTVAGPQTSVVGCYFHYTQALMRRARQEGLGGGGGVIQHGSSAFKLVRLYCALATLPPREVPLALAEIEGVAKPIIANK